MSPDYATFLALRELNIARTRLKSATARGAGLFLANLIE